MRSNNWQNNFPIFDIFDRLFVIIIIFYFILIFCGVTLRIWFMIDWLCDSINILWSNLSKLWSWWNLHKNTNNRNVEIELGKKSHKPIIMRTYVSWCFRASSPQNINTYGIAYFQMPTPYTAYIVSWFFTSVFIQRFLHFQL